MTCIRLLLIQLAIGLGVLAYAVSQGPSNTLYAMLLFGFNDAYRIHFVRSQLQPVEFQVPMKGATYHGMTGSYQDDFVIIFGGYEKGLLSFIEKAGSKLAGGQPVIYDVGAHTGQHSLQFSRYAKSVYSFDPYPPVIKRFQLNMRANNVTNVRLFQVGLGNLNTELPFSIPNSDNLGMGTFTDRLGSEHMKLRIERGDDLREKASLPCPDIMKMDIEGYEKQALLGLQKTLAECRPLVVVEVAPSEKGFESFADLRGTFPERYAFYELKQMDPRTSEYKLKELSSLPLFTNLAIIPSEHKERLA